MSTPSQSTDVDPTSTTTTTNTTTNTYEYISSYNFASDLEFRKGLGTIMGHRGTPASDSELLNDGDDVVLQAKCFYISRKRNISPSIDFTAYKNWLLENGLTPEHNASSSNNDQNAAVASSSSSTVAVQDENSTKAIEPAYPTSFAHIVELITNNQPIPGIEEIPDTVLSGHDEPSKAARRRKPWEKDEVVDDSNS
ncbi:hypothetical protein UA08_07693 [Talaromyces atroroseus]|uniref:Uncharacterized protein n=1 Tax=Talaromyces atroroseus TaxID=1441469 RepID=A0A225AJN1_TALAT|nr:hypothetical protein UA08_07693 [Talaromyces atroroseus]OKL57378.1 hypothetical protein UA08_07693 [Talaromyces atroroseus]